jgi:hypothetical protein
VPDIRTRVQRALYRPDQADSVLSHFRRRRWQLLLGVFPELESMRVLDLGGRISQWVAGPVRPAQVVVLNAEDAPESDAGFRVVRGDACAPPEEITTDRFDLVYSNSLIEHVGGYHRRAEMAEHVGALARRHWIQTPYRYFPVEPHWMMPGLQFLPLPARLKLSQLSPWGRIDEREGLARLLNVELLTRTEMQFLFPASEILTEHALGLPKSLIAVRR